MRWLKSAMWKMGIAIAGLLFFSVLMLWMPLSVAAHEGITGLPTSTPVTVQPTPTADATMVALQKKQLMEQITQLQRQDDRSLGAWLWNSIGAVGIIVAALVALFGVVTTVMSNFNQWKTSEDASKDKDRLARQDAHAKDLRAQAEDRFKTAVTALGDKNEGTQVGGAVLLRSFLNPNDKETYGLYYNQILDLAVAYLRLSSLSKPSDDPDGMSPPPEDPDASVPLTPLRRVLITLFKEVFPLARDRLKEQDPKKEFQPQSLDSSGIVLDGAFLRGADLKQAWMTGTSLREVVLYQAKLTGTNLAGANLAKANLMEAELNSKGTILNRASFIEAHLEKADLSEAYLIETDLSQADLSQANLSGAGLWRATLKKTTLQGATLTDVDLNQADLAGADIHGAILTGASLSGSNLGGADLRYADLNEVFLADADLRGADLSNVKHLDTAKSLERTDMHGVTGLSDEQLKACESKGAMIDQPATAVAAQPVVPSPVATQDTDPQAAPAQVNTPDPCEDESNTAATKQSSDVQHPTAPLTQQSTPPPSTDSSSSTSSQPSTGP